MPKHGTYQKNGNDALSRVMIKYLIKRFFAAILTLISAVVLVAALVSLAPGSEGLYVERLFDKIQMVITLDFGFTNWNRLPVSEVIFDRLLNTLILAGGAVIFNILFSLPLGVYFGVYPNSRVTKVISTVIIFISVTPILVLGYIAVFVLARNFGFLPTYDQIIEMQGIGMVFGFMLPMVVLGLGDGLCSEIVSTVREEISKTLRENFIVAVRARGVSLVRHVAKNTVIPIYTVIISKLSYLLGGAVIVEYIFNWKGFGYQTLNAAWNQDYNFILAATLVFAALIVLADFSKEILVAVVNPRPGDSS